MVFVFVLIVSAVFSGCEEERSFAPAPQTVLGRTLRVRVLLCEKAGSCNLQIPSRFTIACGPEESTKTCCEKTDLPLKVAVVDGKLSVGMRVFEDRQIAIRPDELSVFQIDRQAYRGDLILAVNADGLSFMVVNDVPLESYLAGVVGAEMPYYWEMGALKAQAIAARTYCLYIKKQFGANRGWDVCKTQANQVYLGIAAESPRVWEAVNSTRAEVLVCEQPGGQEGLFPAYYSSTCAGHTEDSGNVFGDAFIPLKGVRCPYCKDVAKASMLSWPAVRLDVSYVSNTLSAKYPTLKALGQIKKIEPSKMSDYGELSRMASIKLTGLNGGISFLRAEDFRLSLDPSGRKIKSTACKVVGDGNSFVFTAGKGWGHGVGLCQYGAEGMARQGKTASEILAYYYPCSRITRIY